MTKWSFSAMPAPASKVEEWLSPLKSHETTWNREEIVIHMVDPEIRIQSCYHQEKKKEKKCKQH